MLHLPRRLTTAQWLVLALSVLVCLTQVWIYRDRVTSYETSHRSLAQNTSVQVAKQVSYLLVERQRLVQLFAEDHLALLRQLRATPESEALQKEMARLLKRAFPDFFAFTITDAKGQPLFVDFEGFVGDICVQDIQTFASSGEHQARIHPNSHRYHYDVMAGWHSEQDMPYMLMVSFEPTELGNILKAIEPPGHTLMLVQNTEPPLMEVTARGARDKTPRTDYRLTQDEMTRMLAQAPVQQSMWQVADLQQPGFFNEFRSSALRYLLFFLIAFGFVIGAALVLLGREEHRRQAAEKGREELVSVITHELRTPVTAISGTLSLMSHGAMGELPPVLKSSLALLERNAERLRQLIDDLLESRQIESGHFSLKRMPVNLRELLSETISHLRDYAGKLEVSVELADGGDTLWVNADPVRIQQVAANLISNAVKYSPHQDVVQVSVAELDAHTVRVSVADHGPGIPIDFQPRIFEKFARGPAPQNRQVVSTGLGLNIVQSLVQAHGGRVSFVTVEGKGTTFHVDLPLIEPPDSGAGA